MRVVWAGVRPPSLHVLCLTLQEEQEKAHPTNPFANALENNQVNDFINQAIR